MRCTKEQVRYVLVSGQTKEACLKSFTSHSGLYCKNSKEFEILVDWISAEHRVLLCSCSSWSYSAQLHCHWAAGKSQKSRISPREQAVWVDFLSVLKWPCAILFLWMVWKKHLQAVAGFGLILWGLFCFWCDCEWHWWWIAVCRADTLNCKFLWYFTSKQVILKVGRVSLHYIFLKMTTTTSWYAKSRMLPAWCDRVWQSEFAILKAEFGWWALSWCFSHGAALPDTGKAQLPHGAFRDGFARERPTKRGSRMDWLAVGFPWSRQLSVLEAAVIDLGAV